MRRVPLIVLFKTIVEYFRSHNSWRQRLGAILKGIPLVARLVPIRKQRCGRRATLWRFQVRYQYPAGTSRVRQLWFFRPLCEQL